MNALKKILYGGLILFCMDAYGQCSADYELFWSDEFDGTEVDTDHWSLVDGGGGFGNQEVQYYKPENATVSDGLLHIKLAHETVVDGSTTYNYTSAKLWTISKLNVQYGKYEARIKMPNAVGSWPAFWMLGSNYNAVGWPKCGEIDVMEWVGRGPNAASGSIFFEGTWPDNHISTPYNIPQGQSFITDFHTFAVEWEPNEIRYYCDGNHYATYKNTTIAPKNWLFNQEFFLILNCAIGGTGGGNVISFTDPEYMEVDYVRAYALPTTAETIDLKGPKMLMENSQNVVYTTNYLPNTTYEWILPNGATIVDGEGTNTLHVNLGTEGGKVKVTATNSCATLADSLTVNILGNSCTIAYDDFDAERNVSYQSTGTLTEAFANPAQDVLNSSAQVAKYERNINETYDVLRVKDIALESAATYENNSNVFYMDVLTSEPLNTQITLQVESSALNGGAYPQGRRSGYIGRVTKQNEWHTVKFNFNSIISAGTQANQVDEIALLFDPGQQTGGVYYLDNFRREKNDPGCPLITSIKNQQESRFLNVYPNPVMDVLYVEEAVKSETVSVYNHLGEKVMESSGEQLRVGHLPAGMYFLRTESNTKKFVKQ